MNAVMCGVCVCGRMCVCRDGFRDKEMLQQITCESF